MWLMRMSLSKARGVKPWGSTVSRYLWQHRYVAVSINMNRINMFEDMNILPWAQGSSLSLSPSSYSSRHTAHTSNLSPKSETSFLEIKAINTIQHRTPNQQNTQILKKLETHKIFINQSAIQPFIIKIMIVTLSKSSINITNEITAYTRRQFRNNQTFLEFSYWQFLEIWFWQTQAFFLQLFQNTTNTLREEFRITAKVFINKKNTSVNDVSNVSS